MFRRPASFSHRDDLKISKVGLVAGRRVTNVQSLVYFNPERELKNDGIARSGMRFRQIRVDTTVQPTVVHPQTDETTAISILQPLSRRVDALQARLDAGQQPLANAYIDATWVRHDGTTTFIGVGGWGFSCGNTDETNDVYVVVDDVELPTRPVFAGRTSRRCRGARELLCGPAAQRRELRNPACAVGDNWFHIVKLRAYDKRGIRFETPDVFVRVQ